MYPEIFNFSFLHTCGVLVSLVFLAGLWMAGKLGKTAGLNPDNKTLQSRSGREAVLSNRKLILHRLIALLQSDGSGATIYTPSNSLRA